MRNGETMGATGINAFAAIPQVRTTGEGTIPINISYSFRLRVVQTYVSILSVVFDYHTIW
jgi:hypothetical protein